MSCGRLLVIINNISFQYHTASDAKRSESSFRNLSVHDFVLAKTLIIASFILNWIHERLDVTTTAESQVFKELNVETEL